MLTVTDLILIFHHNFQVLLSGFLQRNNDVQMGNIEVTNAPTAMRFN